MLPRYSVLSFSNQQCFLYKIARIMSYPKKRMARISRTKPYNITIFRGSPKLWIYQSSNTIKSIVMVHLSKAHYKPDEPDSEYKWTEYQCLLVTLCHVPWLGKKAPQFSSCDQTSASFADDWKSNERETGSCLWHPVGMPPGFPGVYQTNRKRSGSFVACPPQ